MIFPASDLGPGKSASWAILLQRRMVIVLVVVCLINTTWQLFRAWLHLFLQEGRGYTESQTLIFNSIWFAATDVGCLGVGAVVLWLCCARRWGDSGTSADVHGMRRVCA